MTAVFVHGNPETSTVWAPLLEKLGRDDVVTLSPPGFGAPVPEGFGSTYEEYVGWLVAELETMGEPVDLVGHDWGANHVIRLACERPDLIRSWCADTAGVFAPDYVWHDASQVWQTPGAGEESIALLLGLGVEGRTSVYQSLGVTTEIAKDMAVAYDEVMGQSILNVYRSAVHIGADSRDLLSAAAARPGLVVIPREDIYTGSEAMHRWTAEQMGAQVVVLEGVGHWWMVQDPSAGAAALEEFWNSL